MENNKIPVNDLLPQQPPFRMVDYMLHLDETDIITCFKVKTDNIFVENGVLTEPGIIENIAQTGATRMGYINKYKAEGDIKLGFIGEIKKLLISRCPAVHDELITTVILRNEVLSTLLVDAMVRVNEELIASCNMKIVMTDIKSGI